MNGAGTAAVARRLEDLVDSVAALLEVECVGLLLRDSDDQMRTVTTSGAAAAALERAQAATGVGPGPDVQRAGIPVAVPDVLAVPDYAGLVPLVRGDGVRAVLSAPVVADDAVIGNLNAVDAWPHGWTDRQQAALQTFAALVADLLLLSAAGRGQDVAHLTDRLADLDGAAS
ncbi:GAF domain-containing protein [Klenkia brasiliensis]|uniref:GAF domain-containing protein n=1 Tax=Klenkia brasiliensis TaxID=333142 RepID=A0A1G7QKR8_9ACTN|nr:GAF domain-containing protein [Klenkia brasiliensis]SDF98499.1 GAF domain-containing protein [Klenkia brasiliensis]